MFQIGKSTDSGKIKKEKSFEDEKAWLLMYNIKASSDEAPMFTPVYKLQDKKKALKPVR